MVNKLKRWAKQLKSKVFVLYYAYKDKRTPLYAKVLAACVVAYAFSPIDLIPDFIPVLGYIDDLILVPIGIASAYKLLPREVVQDCKVLAEERMRNGKPTNWLAGIIMIGIWVAVLAWVSVLVYRHVFR